MNPVIARGLLALAVVVTLAACVAPTGPGDAIGKNGKVVFTTETQLAFTTRLVVGSTFNVGFKARDDKDKAAVEKAVLDPSDQKVLTVDAGVVTVVGPGTAELRVNGADGTIDFIEVHAGNAGATTLVDAQMLATTDVIDARLPATFAIKDNTDVAFAVAAVDKCGGQMLDLHASSIETAGTQAAVTASGPAQFVLKTQVPGTVNATLKTPGLDDLAYTIGSVEPSAIDEVHVDVASVDDQANATLWGRAFADDAEVVGDIAFTWSADERVSLQSTTGLVVIGNVSFPAQGQPADDRPAVVTAEVFGEQGTVDLLSSSVTTVTSRGDPARVLPAPEASGGCGSKSAACDPEAALVVVAGLRGLRGLRRLRRARGATSHG